MRWGNLGRFEDCHRLQATRDPFEARRVYDEVLALRGGAPGGDEAHAPLLRLRLLRSTLAVLRDAAVRPRR